MSKSTHFRPVVPGSHRDTFLLPADAGAEVRLNPIERTLFHIFLTHPEGIAADRLILHWQELRDIYLHESCFDDPSQQEDALEALCAESRTTFYTNISRIKRKLTALLGARRAAAYIIRRGKDGRYRTHATFIPRAYTSNTASGTKSRFSP